MSISTSSRSLWRGVLAAHHCTHSRAAHDVTNASFFMFATRVARANYVNTKSIGEGMSLGSQQPFSTAEAEAAKHLDQRRRASSRASRCPRRGSIDVDKVGAGT